MGAGAGAAAQNARTKNVAEPGAGSDFGEAGAYVWGEGEGAEGEGGWVSYFTQRKATEYYLGGPSYGTFKRVPAGNFASRGKPFKAANSIKLILYLAAIELNVSPCLTI